MQIIFLLIRETWYKTMLLLELVITEVEEPTSNMSMSLSILSLIQMPHKSVRTKESRQRSSKIFQFVRFIAIHLNTFCKMKQEPDAQCTQS